MMNPVEHDRVNNEHLLIAQRPTLEPKNPLTSSSLYLIDLDTPYRTSKHLGLLSRHKPEITIPWLDSNHKLQNFLQQRHHTSSAIPANKTPYQLDQEGIPRQSEIKLLVIPLNHGLCKILEHRFLNQWWETLGQSLDNIRCSSLQYIKHMPLDPDPSWAKICWKLKTPVHRNSISDKDTFQIYTSGGKGCTLHEDKFINDEDVYMDQENPCYTRLDVYEFECILL